MSEQGNPMETETENVAKHAGEYGGDQIQVLEGLSAIRKRPGMYVGGNDKKAMHHLLWEMIDNGGDEHIAGYCDFIHVILHDDESCEVRDNGRGIPVGWNAQMKESALYTATHRLHAGGKFGGGGYTISGGLHGVGLKGVNALSTRMVVTVHQNGKSYQIEATRGEYVSGLSDKKEALPIGDTDLRGTWVRFSPDREQIFTDEDCQTWEHDSIRERIERLTYLNPGLKIRLEDRREGFMLDETFVSNGLSDMVKGLNPGNLKTVFPEPFSFMQKATDETGTEYVQAKLAFNWLAKGYNTQINAFANNIFQASGGKHVDGLKQALSIVLRDHVAKHKTQKEKDIEVSGNDILEGFVGAVVVYLPEDQLKFTSQTKESLASGEAYSIIYNAVKARLSEYLEENPTIAKELAFKAINAAKGRLAAQRAKELSRAQKSESLLANLDKVEPCTGDDPTESEIFLVEGDSAGGSAIQGRNPKTQAILKMRGKILNVAKETRRDKVIKHQEIATIITELNCGIVDDFDIAKIKYHKVVIMTDADVDGSHIRCLLITFFQRYMPGLIEAGMLYRAMPPLYMLRFKGQKEPVYAYSEEEKDQLIERFGGSDKLATKPQRYKGLGEMDPLELKETTMDPATRKLIRLTFDDTDEAIRVIDQCMGDAVEPRVELIRAYRNKVQIDSVA